MKRIAALLVALAWVNEVVLIDPSSSDFYGLDAVPVGIT